MAPKCCVRPKPTFIPSMPHHFTLRLAAMWKMSQKAVELCVYSNNSIIKAWLGLVGGILLRAQIITQEGEEAQAPNIQMTVWW